MMHLFLSTMIPNMFGVGFQKKEHPSPVQPSQPNAPHLQTEREMPGVKEAIIWYNMNL